MPQRPRPVRLPAGCDHRDDHFWSLGPWTGCSAKYRTSSSTSTTDHLSHERWATVTGKPASGGLREYSPAVIDLRSRPWAGTAVTRTRSLVDTWEPRTFRVVREGAEHGNVAGAAACLARVVPPTAASPQR